MSQNPSQPAASGAPPAASAASGPTPERIMQIGTGFWGSKVLLSAVELGVFTSLAQKPANYEELRQRLGLAQRGSRDFFDALVAFGFLERSAEGIYSNGRDANVFLDKAKPSYIGGLFEMANARLWHHWGKLTDALRTGQSQSEVKTDEEGFGALYADPNRLKQFLRAMSGGSRAVTAVIAQKFPWQNYKTFADIGPAQGEFAVQVAKAHAHIHGIGFDLPPVGPIFTEYLQENKVADRVKFQAGDFFKEELPKADVVVFGRILHDWDLNTKKMLLEKAYRALPDGGAVIVFEALIDDDRRSNVFGMLMSLNMLVETPGGFDFTGADCIGWMKEAGFNECRVEHLVGPNSMAIGIKKSSK